MIQRGSPKYSSMWVPFYGNLGDIKGGGYKEQERLRIIKEDYFNFLSNRFACIMNDDIYFEKQTTWLSCFFWFTSQFICSFICMDETT